MYIEYTPKDSGVSCTFFAISWAFKTSTKLIKLLTDSDHRNQVSEAEYLDQIRWAGASQSADHTHPWFIEIICLHVKTARKVALRAWSPLGLRWYFYITEVSWFDLRCTHIAKWQYHPPDDKLKLFQWILSCVTSILKKLVLMKSSDGRI